MRIVIALMITVQVFVLPIEAQITKTVSVPQEKYAAYMVPDPGSALTLKIVPDGTTACEINSSSIQLDDESDTVQWSPTTATPTLHQYDIGVVLSSREWVSIHGDYKPCGQGGGTGTPPPFDVDVPGVDLDIENIDEDKEESEGAGICLNDDDDNASGTADKDDTGATDNENDLVKITIRKVQPDSRFSGTGTLSAPSGGSKIKIWEAATRGSTPISLPKTYSTPSALPKNLWVEGVAASGDSRDIELKVSYTTPSESKTTEDKVKFSVIKANSIEVYKTDTTTWADADKLPWEKILFRNENLKFKVTLNVPIESLTSCSCLIQARTYAEPTDEEHWHGIALGSDDSLSTDKKDIRVTVTGSEVISLTLLPANGADSTDEYASSDSSDSLNGASNNRDGTKTWPKYLLPAARFWISTTTTTISVEASTTPPLEKIGQPRDQSRFSGITGKRLWTIILAM